MLITPVLLCGGLGTRLWPLSVPARPKPFLKLWDGLSLFAHTVQRFEDRSLYTAPIVVVSQASKACLDVEPLPTDTCVLFEAEPLGTTQAIRTVAQKHPEIRLAFVPADHFIENLSAFHEGIALGAQTSETSIGVLGYTPTEPNPHYGYILPESTAVTAPVSAFLEKPDAIAAGILIERGALWNGGVFLGKGHVFLAALEACGVTDDTRESFDKAVLQRAATHRVSLHVARVHTHFNDVGTFLSLYKVAPKDIDGNAVIGSVTHVGCQKCLLWGEGRENIHIDDQENVAVIAANGLIRVLPLE
jgi:mannose-1-phosphate guanylyltransferase